MNVNDFVAMFYIISYILWHDLKLCAMCNNLQDREDKCRNQKSAAATLSNTSKEEQRPLCASLGCKKLQLVSSPSKWNSETVVQPQTRAKIETRERHCSGTVILLAKRVAAGCRELAERNYVLPRVTILKYFAAMQKKTIKNFCKIREKCVKRSSLHWPVS